MNVLIACFLTAAVLCVLGVSFVLSLQVTDRPRHRWHNELEAEAAYAGFSLSWWEGLEKEPVSIASPHGYELKGLRVRSGESPKGTVVLCHGHGWCLAGSIKYMKLFLEQGFDAIIYDNRSSGDSGGKRVTMGYFEKDDLSAVIAFERSRPGFSGRIGTHGESMGAATVILQGAVASSGASVLPDFVVADCPFSDLSDELAWNLKSRYGLPREPFLLLSSAIARLRCGFAWKQVSPIRAIEQAGGMPNVPLFLVHGSADSYILPKMSEDLFAAKQGVKRLLLVPDAGHGRSLVTAPGLYAQELAEFLSQTN